MLPPLIKLSWVHDLGSPRGPGKVIANGVRVDVSDDKFYSAETALAKGATDLIFSATLVPSIAGESYYVLGTFEVI